MKPWKARRGVKSVTWIKDAVKDKERKREREREQSQFLFFGSRQLEGEKNPADVTTRKLSILFSTLPRQHD